MNKKIKTEKLIKICSIINIIIIISIIIKQVMKLFPKNSTTRIDQNGLVPTFLWIPCIIVLLMQIINIFILSKSEHLDSKYNKLGIIITITILIATFFINVLWMAPLHIYMNIYMVFLTEIL